MNPEEPDLENASVAEIFELARRDWERADRALRELARLGHPAEWPEVVLEDILDAEVAGEEYAEGMD